tara:strand:- start:26048 stop:26374 length:327 start_codon:yes stop_codon:yes gene_type:complete
MKRSAAYLTAVLSSLPADALGQCPEDGQLNECELALFETATILEGRNKECNVLLKACTDKMQIRTSTVIREIVKPCPEDKPKLNDWQLVLTTGLAGFVIGALAALLAG